MKLGGETLPLEAGEAKFENGEDTVDSNTIRIIAGVLAVVILVIIVYRRKRKTLD
jgi:predicted RND superfamily exporter protein